MLEWLQNSWLGLWIAESLWGYPIVLSMHAVGMGAIVGLSWIFAARVLGAWAPSPLSAFRRLMRIAWIGLVVNVSTGFSLFAGRPEKFWASWPFKSKLVLIAISLALTFWLFQRSKTKSESPLTKHLAVAVCIFWGMAIIAGRLIAYIDVD